MHTRIPVMAGLVLTLAWLPARASAHVTLLTPADGATLTPGSTYTVTWEVAIPHDTRVWHLDYSPDGSRWTDIQRDMSVDTRSHDWTVPDADCSPCVVRITQDNDTDSDYDDRATVTIGSGGASDGGPGTGSDGGSDGGPGTGSDGGCAVVAGGSRGSTAALVFGLALLVVPRRSRRRLPPPG